MSAFIKLNKQDAYISTYNAYKAWHVSSSDFVDYGIEYYLAVSGSSALTGIQHEVEAGALYSSLKQLYYSGATTGAILTASLYEDYQQTTLFPSMSRSLPDMSLVLAIPQNIFGDAIRPGTFTMGTDEPIQEYISGAYINTGYFKAGLPNGYNIYDDGEGIIRESVNHSVVGYIIYTHGIVNIVDSTAMDNITRYQTVKVVTSPGTVTGVTTAPIPTNGVYSACGGYVNPIGNPFTRPVGAITALSGVWFNNSFFNVTNWAYQAGDRLKVSYDANNYYEATVVKYPSYFTQPVMGVPTVTTGMDLSVDTVVTDGTTPLSGQVCIEPISVGGANTLNPSNPSTTVTTCYLETQNDYLDVEYFVDCDEDGASIVSTPGTVLPNQQGYSVRWNSTLPVYTRTYRCKVRNEQLNHTYNNSASSGSQMSGSEWMAIPGYDEQTFLDNVTGSYFQPYVTAVGLYNDAHELIAVGKLAQPTPKSKYTDMTFVINLDI